MLRLSVAYTSSKLFSAWLLLTADDLIEIACFSRDLTCFVFSCVRNKEAASLSDVTAHWEASISGRHRSTSFFCLSLVWSRLRSDFFAKGKKNNRRNSSKVVAFVASCDGGARREVWRSNPDCVFMKLLQGSERIRASNYYNINYICKKRFTYCNIFLSFKVGDLWRHYRWWIRLQ